MTVASLSDPEAGRYVDEIVRRLTRLVNGKLQATYVIGSLALGDYVPGRSDVDVLAVSEHRLPMARRREVVEALSHPALPCPTRGLEFVLYDRASAAVPNRAPDFQINLNTGPGIEQHATFDHSLEPSHWFVLDIAIARERGVAVLGPPASALFATIPRRWIVDSLVESLDWHVAHEPLTHNSVLNACRSWRFVEEGIWDSKAGAAAWARGRAEDPLVLDAALALREGTATSPPDPELVRVFLRRVRETVASAA